ncbi:N-acyl-D-aspartate/D-glutamate deacylase [Actinobacteria bacterium IMCC26256]|nr:N-acyl-D-aspartate/D-glutamate deacylase [Actinobacteria bacterium IMCC26256]
MTADIVIRDGLIVDGTGTEGYQADIAVSGGMISEIGKGLKGNREIDASGQVVSPGFIDIHTHYDAQVFWDPALTPSSHHGVTSVIAGNCGFSIAPCLPEHRSLLGRTLQHVEDMNLATLEAGIPWDFETFAQYLDSVERRGVGINFGCYVGHTAVRLNAMGDEGYERETPTEQELRAMQILVDDALRSGAMGFASSSSATHSGDGGRPVPSRLADLAEFESLLAPLRDQNKGVIATLPGERVKHADLYALQRRIGRPLTWTALLTVKGFPYHEQVIEDNDAAHAAGGEVWPQISVRPLVFQMNLREPFTFNMAPAFRDLMAQPDAVRLDKFADHSWRRMALDDLTNRTAIRLRWESLSVAESASRPELAGKSIVDEAAAAGCSPLDFMLDLSIADSLETRFNSVLANDDEDAIAWLLQRDGVLLGLMDSGAHVSQLCDACMPTDLLGKWVRDREVITLERAIHKLTGEPARVFGLDGQAGRGLLKVGMAADITVFNPDTVAPGPLRRVSDFPANGERLTADAPVGMNHILVNGSPIRSDGMPVQEVLDAMPGKVLRS